MEKEIYYIHVRYILAVLITIAETAAIVAIVVALMYKVPYFSIAVLLTQIGVILQIINSNDNADITDTISKSEKIEFNSLKDTLFNRFIRSLVRIFAPML